MIRIHTLRVQILSLLQRNPHTCPSTVSSNPYNQSFLLLSPSFIPSQFNAPNSIQSFLLLSPPSIPSQFNTPNSIQFNPSAMTKTKALSLGLTLILILQIQTLKTLTPVSADDASFARSGQLSVSTSFSASPGIQLLRNDTLTSAVLSSPSGAAQLGLLLHTYNGKQGCSAALLNSTSYILWMRPCPPLVYSNCTLTFSAAGELILATEGVVRWNSNTYSKGGGGIRITDKSELQILNKNNQSVWSSNSDATPSACLAQFEPLEIFAPAVAACPPSSATSDDSDSDASCHFSMVGRLASSSFVSGGVLLWLLL